MLSQARLKHALTGEQWTRSSAVIGGMRDLCFLPSKPRMLALCGEPRFRAAMGVMMR